jgi:predicted nucleic acid-binding protein
MSIPNLFFDSSALFAGIISATGAARALRILSEGELITITTSEQVVAETERALARKAPMTLIRYREALVSAKLRIFARPSAAEVRVHQTIIAHQADVPIVVAAMQAKVDYLITLNRRHFIDDPAVARRSGLRIGTPGDGLTSVRGQLTSHRDW